MLAVLRIPELAAVVAVTALTMLGHFSFFTYVAPFLLDAGLTENAIGPVLFGYGAAGLVGLLATGALVDRRPRGLMLAGVSCLAAAFITLMLAGTSTAVAIVASAATGLALGSLPVLLQAAVLWAAPAATDQASAVNASAFNAGIGGGALLGGLTLDQFGATALPVLAATLSCIGLLTLAFARRVGVPATAPS
jgi:predicted MFS family arabinose efflux permease